MRQRFGPHPLIAATIGIMACLTIGCDYNFPGKPNPANRPIPDDQVVSFDLLFKRNCVGCHGAEGRLGPAPPLNDPIFLSIVPDELVLRTISHGRPGTPMPAFAPEHGGTLTSEQIKILAEGIRPHWQSNDGKKPAAESMPAYELTGDSFQSVPGDAARGASLFARNCAGCHGEHGIGGSDAIGGAIAEPAFLALISNQALRRIIITGRPDLGMPNFAQSKGRPDDFQPLTSPEIDDLVALLASWRDRGGAVARVEEKKN